MHFLYFIFVICPILLFFNWLWDAANKQQPPSINISVPPPPYQPPSPEGPFDLVRHMHGQVRAERTDKIEKFPDGYIRAERHDIIEGYLRQPITFASFGGLSFMPNMKQQAYHVYERRTAMGIPGDAESDWAHAVELHRLRQSIHIFPAGPSRRR